jgi:hypothetical protein
MTALATSSSAPALVDNDIRDHSQQTGSNLSQIVARGLYGGASKTSTVTCD